GLLPTAGIGLVAVLVVQLVELVGVLRHAGGVLVATAAATATATTATARGVLGVAGSIGVFGSPGRHQCAQLGFVDGLGGCGRNGRARCRRFRLRCRDRSRCRSRRRLALGTFRLSGLVAVRGIVPRRLLAFLLRRLRIGLLLARSALVALLAVAAILLLLLLVRLGRRRAAIAALAVVALLRIAVALVASRLLRAVAARLAVVVGTRRCGGRRGSGRGGGAVAEPAEQARDDAAGRGGGDRRGRRCLATRLHRLRLRRGGGRFLAHRRRGGRHDAADCGLLVAAQRLAHLRDRRGFDRGEALVAGLAVLAHVRFLDPLDLDVRRLKLVVGHDHHVRLVAQLDLDHAGALLVEQEVGHRGRRLHQHLAGVVLHRVLFNEAQG